MHVSFSKAPLFAIPFLLIALLSTSCSKNYDLVSDYVVLEKNQTTKKNAFSDQDALVAAQLKDEKKATTSIASN